MSENYRKIDDPNFDYDHVNGVRQRLVIEQDGGVHLESSQDVSDIIKAAHESRGSYSKFERLGDDVKVASIPMLVMHDLMKKGIWQDKKALWKWLNTEGQMYKTREIML
jgi:hypothetical protein